VEFGYQLSTDLGPRKTATNLNRVGASEAKNSVRTSKKTQHFTITQINWLTLFEEIVYVCFDNYMMPQNATLLIVKADGTYSYHSALRVNKVIRINYIGSLSMTRSD
jgi:hypothetical protein